MAISLEQQSNYFKFSLKPQQKKAFISLQQFVSNSNHKIFILKGYAGTGKTTLMGRLIKWLDDKEIDYSLLASTGRAAKILSNLTGAAARTVHSQIYTFNNLSEDIEEISKIPDDIAVDSKGQISLVFELIPVHSTNEKVYIVDEASMIADQQEKNTSFARYGSGKLLNDLLNYDNNGKFIFVGDPSQLPPINQQISPALSKDYLKITYKVAVDEFTLTDIVRQSNNNGIIEASLKLRNLHLSNPSVKWANLPLRGHNNILFHNSSASILQTYIETLKTKGFEYSTLICQTNKHCSDLNKIIRSALNIGNNNITVGDLIMVTQNNYLSNLVNGDLAVIIKTGKREYKCDLSFLQVQVQELSSKKNYNLLMIENILQSTSTNLNSKQHKDLMIDYFYRMKEIGINQKDRAFKDNMMKDPYLNALKAVYGYALTCHKSQGGEWEEVFLYLDNKIHGIPKPGIYQWWYTAITRAKKKLHIVNDWFIK
jgi:ATP-dependent exoDNAse (exonuclease V) alpha subunit